jgi:2-polyprenyl-3-methyl-5-hydroxy-6-metoxy-1,4-benzoquinol methylase
MQVSVASEQPPQSTQASGRPGLAVCPVCHASAFKPRFTVKGIPVESCEACGLVVQNPQPSDAELAAIYGNDYFIGSSENDRFASQFDVVKRATASLQLDEIAAYLCGRGQTPKGLRLLEVGCGHGNMLLEARLRGYDVMGLEYSADAAQRANRKLDEEIVRVGTIGETPLPERSFDICILIDVIEHVRDPEHFLKEIWRILKDGATVFIATPSVDSWSARALGRHWMEFKPEHLFYFGRATITRLLKNTGFADIAVSTGRKVLTPDYIIGHFEKFPIPIITPALRVMRALMPQALLSRPTKLTASGINVFAAKPRA